MPLNENLLSLLAQTTFKEEKFRLRRKAIKEAQAEAREIEQEEERHREKLDLVDWTPEDRQQTEDRAARLKRVYTTQVGGFKALIEAALDQERETALLLFEIKEPTDQPKPELKSAIEKTQDDEFDDPDDPPAPSADQLRTQIRELAESLSPEALQDVGRAEGGQLDRRWSMPDSTALYNFEVLCKRYLELGGIQNPNQLNLRRSSAVQTLISRTLAAAKGVEIETTANMEEMAEVVA